MEWKIGWYSGTLSKGNINPNARIRVDLFSEKNDQEWPYSAQLAIGEARRIGYIDGPYLNHLRMIQGIWIGS